MIPRFQRTQCEAPLSRVQDQIGKPLDRICADPMVGHVLLTGVRLLAGDVSRVGHTLGRPLVGYVIVRQRAQADVWDGQDANASPDKFLDLYTSDDVTVDVVVF